MWIDAVTTGRVTFVVTNATPRDIKRFLAKVNVGDADSCWAWTAAIVRSYGTFRFKGKQVRAHRFAYELLRGPIPDGLTIDHLCRNTVCMNPAHMEPVTLVENILRARAAKTHCKRGHPLDGENLAIGSKGERMCRECRNAQGRVRGRRVRAEAGAIPGRGGFQAAKTHCPRGHEYTPGNTYQRPGRTHRVCRICRRENNRATRKRLAMKMD